MNGLISFILLVLGTAIMLSAGMLAEARKNGPAATGAIIGSILLLCSWVIA